MDDVQALSHISVAKNQHKLKTVPDEGAAIMVFSFLKIVSTLNVSFAIF